PAPDAPIPLGARRLAAALARTTAALDRAIERWVRRGDPGAWPPPRDVVLLALHQQRIYRELGARPRLARRVLRLLPRGLRGEAWRNATAQRALLSLLPDRVTRAPRLRTRAPLPAAELLGYYREAERRFGVAWEVLAAVNMVESRFGRVTSPSSAGALGPMQFLPSTWRAYGMGGDVRDDRDAILGAANYLAASGAPGDYRRALYAYNPSRAYVRAVWLYARQMMREPSSFYAYYNWQVYVLTPHGPERITGPGSDGRVGRR
ncbi:MAG TPA: lytic transglycosylase domain-containing protein, partial [Actinomycetota bacterium]|nr:lytic transglycosylase domain-containing protein [Actinomycetota bacterium]